MGVVTVDELIVKLGLDPANFDENQKKAQASLNKLANNSKKNSKTVNEGTKSMTDGFENLTRKALMFYGLIIGASSVKDFVVNQTNMNATMGRTSYAMDMSVKALGIWRNMAVLTGGSADVVTGAIRGLLGELTRINTGLTTSSPLIAFMSRLGIEWRDPKTGKVLDPDTMLRSISAKLHDMAKRDPLTAYTVGAEFGINDDLMNILVKGPSEMDRLKQKAIEMGVATDADAAAAQRLQEAWGAFSGKAESYGRNIQTGLTDTLIELLHVTTGIKPPPGTKPGAVSYWEAARAEGRPFGLWELMLGLRLPKLPGEEGGPPPPPPPGRLAGSPTGRSGGFRPNPLATPAQQELERLGWEHLQGALGGIPVVKNSGYSTPAENARILDRWGHHRAANGSHTVPGAGFDIKPKGGMNDQAAITAIKARLRAAGYFVNDEGDHLHVSTAMDSGGRGTRGYGWLPHAPAATPGAGARLAAGHGGWITTISPRAGAALSLRHAQGGGTTNITNHVGPVVVNTPHQHAAGIARDLTKEVHRQLAPLANSGQQ